MKPGRQELLKVVQTYGLDVVRAYMGHGQDNAEESVRRVIDKLTDGRVQLSDGSWRGDRGQSHVDRANRTATVDFTGTSPQHSGNLQRPLAIAMRWCCMSSAPW